MRHEEWPEIMESYIQNNRGKEYKWSRQDCVTFMAQFVHIITGKDVLIGKRYAGEKSAMTLLKKYKGLFRLVDMQFKKFGLNKIKPLQAKRGDVVGFKTKAHGQTVGICVGNMFVSQGEDDLVFLPMSEAVKAWEVK
jgi:hypothetical protein